jgi:Lon protease-like protein
MFPLGTVLLPSALLPLHIFEERYRVLVRHCLDGDQRFGVVLIERGSEVGGGDVRTEVGTVARIVEVARFDDGRFALGAVGAERIRIVQWLPDDPYPRAEIEPFEDPPPTADLHDLVEQALTRVRTLLDRYAALGEISGTPSIELSEDPVLASYQAASLAPVGPADKQRLLAADTAEARLELLDALVEADLLALDQLRDLDDPE